jgi:hypothetical protein
MAFKSESDSVSLTAGNHTWVFTARPDGGFDIDGNGYRLAEFPFGGGRFSPVLSGSLPPTGGGGADVGAIVGEDGYLVVEKG